MNANGLARLGRAASLLVLAWNLVGGLGSPARAATLTADEILQQFNGVITDSFNTTSDVEGRLVAGTIDNTQSASFYTNIVNVPASVFQAVNAITILSCPSCNVANSGKVNYVTPNNGGHPVGFPSGSVVTNLPSPSFSMSDFTTPLNAESTYLAGLSANSSYASAPNSLAFNVTPNSNDVAVFDIPVSTFGGGSNPNITFTGVNTSDPNLAIIINVTGGTSFDAGADNVNFNDPTNGYLNEHIIWNFDDFTSLSFRSWHGSVLAGDASVTNSSAIEGLLYAASFNGGGELHDFAFEGRLPIAAAPEASTWGMLLIGLVGLGAVGGRRHRTDRTISL
jgi:hypothetical protein